MSAPRWYRVAALSPSPDNLSISHHVLSISSSSENAPAFHHTHLPDARNNQHNSNNDSSSIQSIGSFGSDGVVVMDVVPTRVHPTGAATSTCT